MVRTQAAHLRLNQPQSTPINLNQPQSTSINLNQPQSTSINLNQPHAREVVFVPEALGAGAGLAPSHIPATAHKCSFRTNRGPITSSADMNRAYTPCHLQIIQMHMLRGV
jgi:hypothetical protein